MRPFAWIDARSVEAAAAATNAIAAETMIPGSAAPDAALVKAGGVDLLDLMKEGLLAPASLVNLRGVDGLDAIERAGEGDMRIGALATLARVAANDTVKRDYPALAAAAGGSASPEIRNAATLGGNLLQRPRCWYFRAAEFSCLRKGGGHCFAIDGESQHHAVFGNRTCAIVHPSSAATALVALGARVELADADGGKRNLALEDFLIPADRDAQRENDLRPHEILTTVVLPAAMAGARMAHLKAAEKQSFDWPLADVAVVVTLAADGRCASASIVLGAVAPTPHRARAAERALSGRVIDEGTARDAASAALDGATPLAKNAYKLPLIETLTRRAILQAIAPG